MIVGVDGAVLRGTTGVSRYLRDLLVGTSTLNPDFTLRALLPSGARFAPSPEALADLRAAGVEGRSLSVPWSWAVLGALRAGVPVPLDLLMRADVMVFTRYSSARSVRSPNLSFVYDLAHHFVPDTMEPGYARRVERAVARTVEQADRIALISESVRDELVQLHPAAAGRTVVIRPPVPRLPELDAETAVRRLAGHGLRPGFVLHVGTIEPRKNLRVLVQAHASLPQPVRSRHPLVLLGRRGWESAETFALIASTPFVRWVEDPTEDLVASAYAAAALVVFPTRYEGFGLPVLEALAAGRRVLCSDLPVLREVAGGAADYFPHDDAAALADLLHTRLGEVPLDAGMAQRGPSEEALARDAEGPRAFIHAVTELAARSVE